jgi:hypothetical protein
MARFRVSVVASYAPTERRLDLFGVEMMAQPDDVRRRILDWVSGAPGWSAEHDKTIDPPRLTVQVLYENVDAPTEWDARADGQSMFRDECAAAELPDAESVLAHAAPVNSD